MKKPMPHSRALPALALAAVLVSAGACAQQASSPSTSTDAPRQRLDANGDGVIDKAEAANAPRLAQKFDQLDANHDGFLDRSDFQARRQQKQAECFDNADADKDGKLSRTEFDAAKQACHPQGGMHGPRGGDDAPPPPAG